MCISGDDIIVYIHGSHFELNGLINFLVGMQACMSPNQDFNKLYDFVLLLYTAYA